MKRILSLILAALILVCSSALADIDDITPEYAYQYLKESAGFDNMKDESIAWMLWALQIEAHNRGLNVRNAIEEPAAATQPAASVTLPPDSDLSGLAYDELVALNQAVDREIMTRPEWKSVTVPGGVFYAGIDFPAGRYSVSAANADTYMFSFKVKKNEKDYGTTYWLGSSYETTSVVITVEEGGCLDLHNGSVILTRYAGLFGE